MELEKGSIKALTQLLGRSMLAAGLGKSYYNSSGSANRDLYSTLGYKVTPTFEDYYNIYRRQDVGQRIIKAPVDACWRKKPVISEVQGEETNFEVEIKNLVEEKKLWSVLSRLDRITGLGEFGVLFLGFADNRQTSEEVSNKSSLIYLRPYMQSSVTIEAWETDEKNSRFGLPLLYKLTTWSGSISEGARESDSGSIYAHYSRIIHVAEDPIDSDVYGTPQLECILNRLQDLNLVAGGSAEMFWRGALPGYALKTQDGATWNPSDAEALEEEMQAYIHNLQRFVRLTGIDIDNLATQISDPSSHVDILLTLISAAKGIPKRILMGSERGELASSQDERAWNSFIDTRRTDHVENNIIRPTIDRLIKYGSIPSPVSGSYSVEWPDLTVPSFQEEMATAKTVAETLASYSGSPGSEAIVPVKMFLQKYLKFNQDELDKVAELLNEDFEGIEDLPEEEPEEPEDDLLEEEEPGEEDLVGNSLESLNNSYHSKKDGKFISGPSGFASISRGADGKWTREDGSEIPESQRAILKKAPPAWTDVKLNNDPNGSPQVIGKDSKGRTQTLYSAEHSQRAAAEKFARLKEFNEKLPGMRKQMDADFNGSDPKKRECAAVLKLIDKTGFRVGSERDTGGDKEAFGATTLTAAHVKVSGNKISFSFTGKKGVSQNHEVTDSQLASFIGSKVKSGGQIFDVSDSQVRSYLKELPGASNFKVKDFRTWNGTYKALGMIKTMPKPTTPKEFQSSQKKVAEYVSKHLGNTPSMALKAYIDPTVFGSWNGGKA